MSCVALKIEFVGGWQIWCGENPVPRVTAHRTRSLLSYLIVHHGQHHRKDSLSEQFWPKSSARQARTNLRRELLQIRRWHSIAAESIVGLDESVSWVMPSRYELDIEFYKCLFSDENVWNLPAIEELIKFDEKRILPDLHDDWVVDLKTELTANFQAKAESILSGNTSNRGNNLYLKLAKKLTETDNLNEANHELLIRSYIACGKIKEAVRAWKYSRNCLQDDLGVDPGQSLQTLYEKELRSFDVAEKPSNTKSFCEHLVGREPEWKKLTGIDFGDQIGLVLIQGPPGIGKTFLAREYTNYLRCSGRLIAEAGLAPGSESIPLWPVTEWLNSRHLAPILKDIDSGKRAVLKHVLPEIACLPETDNQILPGRFRRERLFSILSLCFSSVEKPLVLFLDDIQWCDSDSLSWLIHLIAKRKGKRIVVVATMRNNRESQLIGDLVESAERHGSYFNLELGPLSDRCVKELGLSALRAHGIVNNHQYFDLINCAGGNPFYVVEIAKAISLGYSDSGGLPGLSTLKTSEGFYAVIRRRFIHLNRLDSDALKLISTLRRSFVDQEFIDLCGFNSMEAADVLASLIDVGALRLDSNSRYRLTHDYIAEAIYHGMTVPHQRHYHSKIAACLTNIHQGSSLVSAEIAFHEHGSGNIESAVKWYMRAARIAKDRLSSETAVNNLDKALGLLSSGHASAEADLQAIELLVEKIGCQRILEGFASENILKTCRVLEKILHRVSDSDIRLQALNQLRTVYSNTNLGRAFEIDLECMELVKVTNDPLLSISARRSMGFTQYLLGQYRDSVATFDEGRVVYHKYFQPDEISPSEISDFPLLLAMLKAASWIRGKPETTEDLYSELLLLKYPQVPARRQIFVRQFLWQLSFFKRDNKNLHRHSAWFDQAAASESNRLIEDFGIWVRGVVSWSEKNYHQAAEHFRKSIRRIDQHTTVLAPQFRVQLAEVALLNNELSEPRKNLLIAESLAKDSGQVFWEAERLRVDALVSEAENMPSKVVVSRYRQSIVIARAHRAVWFEVRSRLDLARYLTRIGQVDKSKKHINILLNRFGRLSQYPEVRDAKRFSHI